MLISSVRSQIPHQVTCNQQNIAPDRYCAPHFLNGPEYAPLSHHHEHLTYSLLAAVAPEIVPEMKTVHTGAGHKAQLVCNVHGEPMPEVSQDGSGGIMILVNFCLHFLCPILALSAAMAKLLLCSLHCLYALHCSVLQPPRAYPE